MKHSYKLALLYLFTSVVMSACPGSEKKSVARIPYEKRSPQDKPNEVPSKEPNRTEGNEISQESLEGEPSTLDNSKDQTTEKDQTTQEDDPEGPSNNQDEV